MIAFLFDMVGGLLIPDFFGNRRTRAQARAFAEGGEVLFEACIACVPEHMRYFTGSLGTENPELKSRAAD
ncbi:hypothetical protein OG521_33955 [Streptomyces sp. NBC_01463]